MLIKLENITKYYHSNTGITMALQKINLEFERGEFVAITGESGSGKSTLLNVLSGMIPFEDGEIYINGEAASSFGREDWENFRKDKIGFVFQDYRLIDKFNVRDNVISAMLIRGFDKKTAAARTKEILEQVGLSEFAKQKAGKLSSGQKQRLSIARALAKDTDIIIADEPTGNLDSVTGRQIIELFAEIAKDKLVIMVTHNYEQAADYVTRQVRLYDGEVVSDTRLKSINPKETSPKAGILPAGSKKSRLAFTFAGMNMTRQPLRTLLSGAFILVTAIISFAFFGTIFSNYDDAHTRKFDYSSFSNDDDRRLVVRRRDGLNINEEDLEYLESIKYVHNVEKYDTVNDINYFIEKDTDYKSTIDENVNGNIKWDDVSKVKFVNYDNFMRSSSRLNESDLKAGELPVNKDEIVLYSDDLSLVGTTKICYIMYKKNWANQYLAIPVKIKGILKEPQKQVYFSEKLCEMLNAPINSGNVKIKGAWCLVDKMYLYKEYFIPVILNDSEMGEPESEYDEVMYSSKYIMTFTKSGGIAHDSCQDFSHGSTGQIAVDTGLEDVDYEIIVRFDTCDTIRDGFIGLREDLFYKLYESGSDQAAVFIDDYAYTDRVIKKIEERGYLVISSFRISSREYDDDLLYERNMLLVISMGVLVILAILHVFVVSMLFRIKIKDYGILRQMGMRPKMVEYINFIELMIHAVLATALTVVAAFVADKLNVTAVNQIMVYMTPSKYIIFTIYNLALTVITAAVFNRILEKKLGLASRK